MYAVGWSDWADSFIDHGYIVKMARKVIKTRKLEVKITTYTPYRGHKAIGFISKNKSQLSRLVREMRGYGLTQIKVKDIRPYKYGM